MLNVKRIVVVIAMKAFSVILGDFLQCFLHFLKSEVKTFKPEKASRRRINSSFLSFMPIKLYLLRGLNGTHLLR
jgi:hypothetical protein